MHVITIHKCDTDGQAERQTTYHGNTTLCYTSRSTHKLKDTYCPYIKPIVTRNRLDNRNVGLLQWSHIAIQVVPSVVCLWEIKS